MNELVRWVLGIYSPTGTVRVQNTPAPTDGRSLALDVDVGAVAAEVRNRIEGGGLGAAARDQVRDEIKAAMDERTLTMESGKARVKDGVFALAGECAPANHAHSEYALANHTHSLSDITDFSGGQNAVTVITGIEWNGTELHFKTRQVTLIGTVGDESSWQTIDTATKITWS